jgi:hypothetical protein
VERRDLSAEGCQAAGGKTVTAGNVQNVLTRLRLEQKDKRGPAKNVEKVIAFIAHALIPELGIGFPGIMRKLVRVIYHTLFLPQNRI